MVDKYRAKRPKLPRSCNRADGIPKKRYTRNQARAAAARHEGYHAYRCPECGYWHAGRQVAS